MHFIEEFFDLFSFCLWILTFCSDVHSRRLCVQKQCKSGKYLYLFEEIKYCS